MQRVGSLLSPSVVSSKVNLEQRWGTLFSLRVVFHSKQPSRGCMQVVTATTGTTNVNITGDRRLASHPLSVLCSGKQEAFSEFKNAQRRCKARLVRGVERGDVTRKVMEGPDRKTWRAAFGSRS